MNYKAKVLNEIEDIPDELLPKIYELIHYFKLGLSKEKKITEQKDSLFGLEDISVDTGIEDFAENHDYYLYGSK
ncbi:MAG TPA: hypothetical protein PK385_11020 [Spirochaetota bacterium]|nr:hypothetical protein [Spirochaetota bacterium]HOS33274.1 hypothetical protein [Spirochaetota bacterium]HOS56578.1 hypothetical protein [Spirochaetota bacterium]HPK62682.1 hypothetical protein [Spirochaetota bacterium]HQF78844.1 hypothetical protein [Spirochaetota bacterium]